MKQAKTVEIVDFSIREVTIPIVGISPLIVHAWSEKSKKMIADKQAKKAKSAKHEIRNPEEEYQQAKHISADYWEGFPAAGFKGAIERAAKIIGLVMKDTRMAIWVYGNCSQTDLIRIYGKSRMRTDMVRVGMGTSDIRYRPEYPEWTAELPISYNEGMLSLDQVFQLVKAAGFCCGVGEMRPEKGKFNYGRFKLAEE